MKVSQAVILAAGESSRFWPLNGQHKSLFKIMGKPLIWHTIEGMRKAGITHAVVVQGPKKEIEKELKVNPHKGIKLDYIVQPRPISTGDALWRARKLIEGPFVMAGAHKADIDKYLKNLIGKFKGATVFSGIKTDTPWEFGMLKFKGKSVVKIVENPKKGREPSDIKTCETYVFPKEIFDHGRKVAEKEDCLIDAINVLIADTGADLTLLKDVPISLKYPWSALSSLNVLSQMKRTISPSAKIGRNVIIKGKVSIGDRAVIGDNTVIEGPCFIGKGCNIGSNNVLRGPVDLEDGVATGAFFEIKNSIVQSGTHFHSGYVGDSVIGRDCRFGAGFITANRRIDRNNVKCTVKGEKIDSCRTYLGAMIGHGTSFGIHCGTMPGIMVGSGCLIGPGTSVFENVKDNTTFFNESKAVKK